MKKKIIQLSIYFDEVGKEMTAELKYTCESKDVAIGVIESYVTKAKRKKGEKADA